LRKKLQHLDQGSMTVQEYYQELQKGMLRWGSVEDTADKMTHFYGGLRPEIHDIIDYNEYTTVNHLFELAMLAEKELQGCHRSRSNVGSTFMPRMTTGQATAPTTRAGNDGTDHTRYRQRLDDRNGAYQECLFCRFHMPHFCDSLS
jgi:hypothetical protein